MVESFDLEECLVLKRAFILEEREKGAWRENSGLLFPLWSYPGSACYFEDSVSSSGAYDLGPIPRRFLGSMELIGISFYGRGLLYGQQ